MKKVLYLFIFILLMVGCKKGPTTWDVDALMPLINTRMSLQQAIPDSLIDIQPGGEMNLIYKG